MHFLNKIKIAILAVLAWFAHAFTEFARDALYHTLSRTGAIAYVQPELRDAMFNGSDNRENFKQIIAKRSDLVRFKRGRLAPSMVPGYYYAGLVLGYASSGGDAGFYKAYNSANTDGSQTAVGVLSEDCNVQTPSSGTIGDGSEAVIIYEGDLFQGLLIGLDAGAISNMNGHSYVEGGDTILTIRS